MHLLAVLLCTLVFQEPAAEWVDGFPLGNGMIGAMVMGGAKVDRIALNHNRLWRRAVERRRFPVAAKLPEFRRLFLAGRFEEAGRLMETDIMQTGGKRYPYVNPFQPLGDLYLEFAGEASDYRRELDLDTGVAQVTYRAGDTRFRREYFVASPEDNLLAIRITADRPGAVSGRIRLDRTERDDYKATHPRTAFPECTVTREAAGSLITMTARFQEGFPFGAVASVATEGGKLTAEGDALRVEGANAAVILVAMATGHESADPVTWCRRQLSQAGKNYTVLRDRRIADHRRLYRRVSLQLGDSLYQRLFDFGRYLMISASRPGGLPMNLQGIWNDQAHPPWDSDFHMDLNLEFNYWPAEVANLSELHQPLFDWVEARMPDARRLAADLFGCRGIYFPIVGDATGLTNVDNIAYSWPGNAGWLAQHFWRHWEYTGDREFLRRRAYPFLKETAAFYLDYLQKDEAGRYRILPSCSPENGIRDRKGWTHFTTVNSAIDLEIAREVFSNLTAAAAILGVDRDQAPRWREVLEHLPEPRVDASGRLSEWSEEVEAEDPAHRHLSPLYGLFPGDRIATSGSTDAARKLLEYRLQFGQGSANGWSFPWRAALFARLGEGDRALEQLDAMARCCLNDNLLTLITDFRGRGGTINWFGSKKVFQIEAGLATTAAIAEMLMQSHGGIIRILPALPARWPAGRVSGLVARGGFVVDIEWSGGRATRVVVHSRLGNRCRIKLDRILEFPTNPGQDYSVAIPQEFPGTRIDRPDQ